jgi:hypothetical protein
LYIIFRSSLVIVLVAHITAVVTVEHESDSPVLIDVECPLPLAATLELVETKTRGVEVTNIRSGIEPCQYSPNLGHVLRVQSSRIPSLEESFQTSMLETDNHNASVTRNVSGVKHALLPAPMDAHRATGFLLGRANWRRGRDSSMDGQARGCSAGDRREPTREGRALPWEGVTGTATNGSPPLPVFKTVSRLPNQTKAD